MYESLISAVCNRLRKGRWFILANTPYGIGMCTPAREDVLQHIEELTY